MFHRLSLTTLAMAAALAGSTMAGCQVTTPDLEPVGAEDVDILHDHTALASDAGISVAIDYREWPGEARITEDVTPLRVAIDNFSDEPITVRYGQFMLLGTSNTTYHALAPFEIDGAVIAKPVKVPQLLHPQIEHRRFRVYDPYRSVYPRLDPFTGSYQDPYYSRQPIHWPRHELPTDEMLERALPEGVIEPQGRLAGYLYFERVDDDEPGVSFHAVFSTPENGDVIATIDAPFEVQ